MQQAAIVSQWRHGVGRVGAVGYERHRHKDGQCVFVCLCYSEKRKKGRKCGNMAEKEDKMMAGEAE